jgi:two-component system LytT family response regulator
MLREEGDIDVIGACATGAEAIEAVRALKPDLVFLDLEMPDVDGFAVIDAIGRRQMPATIIVTAHEDRALRAFDLPAFDYLLKPFGRERLRDALVRARQHLTAKRERELAERLLALAHEAAPAALREQSPERFIVRSGGRVLFVSISEIDWIESHGNYVRLHAGGRTHIVRETMVSLEQRLDPMRFARVHRTRIINLDRVRELRARGNGEYDVVLAEGTQFRVGRAFRQALHERLQRR